MKLARTLVCIGAIVSVTVFLPAGFVIADRHDLVGMVAAVACIFTAMMAMVEGVRAARQIPGRAEP